MMMMMMMMMMMKRQTEPKLLRLFSSIAKQYAGKEECMKSLNEGGTFV